MPGGDGTGPMGRGPLGGRGFGYCPGYRGMGPGYGRPYYGRRARGYGFPHPWFDRENVADEKIFLQQQAEYMKAQIQMIEERLEKIDAPEGDD